MTDPHPTPSDLPFQVVAEAPWQANWPAFDIPRTADILRPENDKLGWEQVTGFRQLDELLRAHYSALMLHRNALANAWQSPAAEAVLQHIDTFMAQLLSDANCAATTAWALNDIMATQAQTKIRIDELRHQWDDVTSDWTPEWWDHAANELNTKAVSIMDETDKALRDHRARITVPEAHKLPFADALPLAPTDVTTESGPSESPSGRQIPPVPGHEPIVSRSDTPETGNGPGLAGAPAPVPATPGQPVSMLPVPPGNPYAPYGGAYILPGPGVGRGGYVVQMPQPSRGSTALTPGFAGSASPARVGSPGTASSGMMPIPMNAGGNPAGAGRNGSKRGGRADTVWEVEKGVPPVIEGLSDHSYIEGRPSAKQEADFQDWFAQLAYPWRQDSKSNNQEPQVILRKAKQ